MHEFFAEPPKRRARSPIAPRHQRLLEEAAIDVELAAEHGVHSEAHNLVFPYRCPSGRVVEQKRPDHVGNGGPKYRAPKGQPLCLNQLPTRGETREVWLVEGTKQALAAASYAPDGVQVLGLGGCYNFRHKDKSLMPGFELCRGRRVLVIQDADAATNLDVFNAGELQADAARRNGATSVEFVALHSIPGLPPKAGLDDALAAHPHEARAKLLAVITAPDATLPEPALERPAKKDPKPGGSKLDDGRPIVELNHWFKDDSGEYGVKSRPLHEPEGEALTELAKLPGLYSFAGSWCEVNGSVATPLSFRVLENRASTALAFVSYKVDSKSGALLRTVHSKPPRDEVEYLHQAAGNGDAERAGARMLTAVRSAPVMAPDGELLWEGFDPDSGVLFTEDTPEPEEMSTEEAKVLLEEVFGEFRAPPAALYAAVLTAAARVTFFMAGEPCPGVLVNAGDGGAGKTLLADCIAWAAGIDPGPRVKAKFERKNAEETGKSCGSVMRSNPDLLYFENLPTGVSFGSPELDAWLTARTQVNARVLGKTEAWRAPWAALCLATGNNPGFAGETARRWLQVRLAHDPGHRFSRSEKELRRLMRDEWPRINSACLALLQDQVQNGSEPGEETCRSVNTFDAWRDLVAGAVARFWGVDACEYLQPSVESETSDWVGMALAFMADESSEVNPVKAINFTTSSTDGLYLSRGISHERDKNPKKLGLILRDLKDKHIDGVQYVLRSAGLNRQKQSLWYVERLCSEIEHARNINEFAKEAGMTRSEWKQDRWM